MVCLNTIGYILVCVIAQQLLNFEDQLKELVHVLTLFNNTTLNLNQRNVIFFQKEVKFLIWITPENIEIMKNRPTLRMLKN